MYPIMRDPNSNILESNSAVGLYDPYDPPNKEYRGYIGYEEGGKFYFGLKKGKSILVSLPLVFWNGARIGIGTDGRYLTPAGRPESPAMGTKRASLHHECADQQRHDPKWRRDVVSGQHRQGSQ